LDRAIHWHEIEEARHAAEAAAASEAAAEAEARAAAEAVIATQPIAASVAHEAKPYAFVPAPARSASVGERGPASPIPRKHSRGALETKFAAEVERLTERELEELVARGEEAATSNATEAQSPVAFFRGVAAEQVYRGLAATSAGEINRLQVDLTSALNGLKFTTN
jgi:hypothetical protein